MALNRELLIRNKKKIVQEWFDSVVETYPEETARFLQRQKDPFQNPVGDTTRKSLEAVFDEIAGDMDRTTLESVLDPLVRIRAVQAFTASSAMGFVFYLKAIIYRQLENELSETGSLKDLLSLNSRIDEVALLAFDVYMRCREKIFEFKAVEDRNRTYNAFKRAGLVTDLSAE